MRCDEDPSTNRHETKILDGSGEAAIGEVGASWQSHASDIGKARALRRISEANGESNGAPAEKVGAGW
jgi:hypothetical protein